MPLLHDRGKRIKANDKDLVYHFVLISLLIVFLVVLLPFHWRTLQSVNWQTVQLDTFFINCIRHTLEQYSHCFLYADHQLALLSLSHRFYKTVRAPSKLARMILETIGMKPKKLNQRDSLKTYPARKPNNEPPFS